MTADQTQGIIKLTLKEWLPKGKETNSAVWELTKQIHSGYQADIKAAKAEAKEKAVKTESKQAKAEPTERRLLTDEERSEELTKFLDSKLLDGTLSAAELAQFKDIYGLKAKDKDVTVDTIDFKEALPESYERIELVKKVIEEEISRANTNDNA